MYKTHGLTKNIHNYTAVGRSACTLRLAVHLIVGLNECEDLIGNFMTNCTNFSNSNMICSP